MLPVAAPDPTLKFIDGGRLVAGRLEVTDDLEAAVEPGNVERHAINGTPEVRQPPRPSRQVRDQLRYCHCVAHVTGTTLVIVGRSRRPTGPVARPRHGRPPPALGSQHPARPACAPAWSRSRRRPAAASAPARHGHPARPLRGPVQPRRHPRPPGGRPARRRPRHARPARPARDTHAGTGPGRRRAGRRHRTARRSVTVVAPTADGERTRAGDDRPWSAWAVGRRHVRRRAGGRAARAGRPNRPSRPGR